MQTEHLSVTGMTCNGCSNSVIRALRGIAGVSDVDISLASSTATVQFDERLASVDELARAIEHAGYSVSELGATRAPQSRRGCCCG